MQVMVTVSQEIIPVLKADITTETTLVFLGTVGDKLLLLGPEGKFYEVYSRHCTVKTVRAV